MPCKIWLSFPHVLILTKVEGLQNLLHKLHVDQETVIKQRRLATWREWITARRWVKGDSSALDMLATPSGPTSHQQHLANGQNLLAKLHVDQETSIKQRRLATWREKVTTDVATACRWVKGESKTLDMLDTPNGPTSHPQHLADELLRRSRAQCDVLPDTAKRDQFFQECQHLIQSHPCELPDINGRELRKMLTRKSKAASSLDGWGPHELAALPEQAFQNLAVLCSTVEKVGRWPHPLLYGRWPHPLLYGQLVTKLLGCPSPANPKMDTYVYAQFVCCPC